MYPELVLENGVIITVDSQQRIANSLAILGNKILRVGTTEEIESLKGPDTNVIDLNGLTVIPGLTIPPFT